MKGKIVQIISEWGIQTKKDGTKTEKPAMIVQIELEDGTMTRNSWLWDQYEKGEQLELEKNGDFWNPVSKKKAAANAQHDEIMNAIRALYKHVDERFDRLQAASGAQTVSTTTLPLRTTVAPAPKPTSAKEAWDQYQASKDTVVDMPEGDEPPSLDDYPL